MATVLISGGTGLIGTALTQQLLQKGYDVIILTRQQDKKSSNPHLSYATWNVQQQTIDEEAVKKADYIIHLAGANVGDKRWTASRKKVIRESRINSGHLLVKAIKDIPNHIKAVISASATGWYGEDAGVAKPFTESDPSASDFLGTTCQQWEDSIKPVMELGKRLVILRTGIVLSNKGGAYAEFKKPLAFGLATVLGSGRQMISWIHIADMVGLYRYALEQEQLQGIYNAVAPQPVTNRQLILAMAHAKGGFHITVRVPALVLKIMLGEMSTEVLKSVTVSNNKIAGGGYPYLFPNIKVAMENLRHRSY